MDANEQCGLTVAHKTDVEKQFRATFRQGLSELGPTYEERLLALRIARRVFHEELATAFAPAFNERLKTMDEPEVEARRKICSWANEELKSVGLAFCFPDSNTPALLSLTVRDEDDRRGRYRLELREADGRAVRILGSGPLPHLALTENSVRQEPLARSSLKPKSRGR